MEYSRNFELINLAAVKRGVAFLDANFPEWRGYVDSTALRMSGSCLCIVGQLSRRGVLGEAISNYYGALEAFANEYPSDYDQMHIGIGLGFEISDSLFGTARDVAWDELDRAWLQELATPVNA